MYTRILLTLDGSKLSRAAIPHACTLAGGTDTEVHVLQVVDPIELLEREAFIHYDAVGASPEARGTWAKDTHFMLRSAALDEVAAAKTQLEAAGVRSVTTAVQDGLAGNEIVDYAQRLACEAIVMATRGHSGLGREVVGSVAEYVLRHSGNAAVVLVGPRVA